MSKKPVTTKIDERGRVSLPVALRKALALEPGDTLFVRQIGNRLELAKAENPFDGLTRHAMAEYEAGQTRSLDDFAREHKIPIDDE